MVVVPEEEEETSLLGVMKMEVPEEEAFLLDEMKKLVQKLRKVVIQWLGTGNSLEGFLDFFDGFIELLRSAFEKPYLLLILPIVEGIFMHLNGSKKTGRGTKAAGHKVSAAMAIATLIKSIVKVIPFFKKIISFISK